MLAETVLAIMLQLGFAPGQSSYSLTFVDADAPAPCERVYDPLCRAAWQDKALRRWVRVETWGEGLVRYWTIAEAINKFANDDELAKLALMVTFHESGWRKDVHAGWNHRPWRRRTKHEDSGRSWCLGQQLVGRSGMKRTRSGTRGRDLVGTGRVETGNCIRAVVHSLEQCRGRNGSNAHAIAACYGGLSARTTHRGIVARAATFAKFSRATKPLSERVRAALALD